MRWANYGKLSLEQYKEFDMCLALPGKILNMQHAADSPDLPMAEVEFSGVKKTVCLAYTPEAKIGDYVIVHVGFAISVLNAEHAQSTLDLMVIKESDMK